MPIFIFLMDNDGTSLLMIKNIKMFSQFNINGNEQI